MTTPETPSDPDKQVLELPSGPVHYSDVGEGPTVVMIHGSPGSGRDFRWLAPGLEGGRRVVRVDVSGHGDTPAHGRAHWTVPGRAAFLQECLEVLDLRDVTLVGHSIGGATVLDTAVLASDRVARVALLSSLGMRPHRLLRGVPVKRLSFLFRIPGMTRVLTPTLRRGMTGAGFPRSTPLHEAVDSLHAVAHLSFEERRATVEAYRALGLPTFVAWTTDDPIIEADIFDELAVALPDGPRLVFPDGKHNPQKAHGVELAAALWEFTAA